MTLAAGSPLAPAQQEGHETHHPEAASQGSEAQPEQATEMSSLLSLMQQRWKAICP